MSHGNDILIPKRWHSESALSRLLLMLTDANCDAN
jgi:hypothetical protein